jgi:hypothetical protein
VADEVPITCLGWKEAGRNTALFVATKTSVAVFLAANFQVRIQLNQSQKFK